MVTTIKFGISFFKNPRPVLSVVFTGCEDKIVLFVDWKNIIYFYVNLLRKHVQFYHVSALLVSPQRFILVLKIESKTLFENIVSQYCKRTDQVTVSDVSLLDIIGAHASSSNKFLSDFRTPRAFYDFIKLSQCALIQRELLILENFVAKLFNHLVKLVDLIFNDSG